MEHMPKRLLTPRLRLRQFREDDLDAFAALQADPVVASHIGDGTTSDRRQSWRIMALFLGGTGSCGAMASTRSRSLPAARSSAVSAAGGRSAGRDWRSAGRPSGTAGAAATRPRRPRGRGRRVRHAGVAGLISLIRPENAASVRVAVKLGASLDRRVNLDGLAVDVYALDRDALR